MLVLALLIAMAGLAQSLALPYWAQPFLDPLIQPYGGSHLLPNVSWTRLYFATPAVGTYAMSPMLGLLGNQLLASWKLAPTDEDQPGQKIMWAGSLDGITWQTAGSDGSNVLFPAMNSSENPGVVRHCRNNAHPHASAARLTRSLILRVGGC